MFSIQYDSKIYCEVLFYNPNECPKSRKDYKTDSFIIIDVKINNVKYVLIMHLNIVKCFDYILKDLCTIQCCNAILSNIEDMHLLMTRTWNCSRL